jgi:hypothetical protein
MADISGVAGRLIASDQVDGTAVYGGDGEKLGSIERFMVDKVSGQAEYAVLRFGSVLGIGGERYPLPWQALRYDPAKGGYVVDVSREQIDGAPSYGEDEPSYDRAYAEQVYGYYGFTYL